MSFLQAKFRPMTSADALTDADGTILRSHVRHILITKRRLLKAEACSSAQAELSRFERDRASERVADEGDGLRRARPRTGLAVTEQVDRD